MTMRRKNSPVVGRLIELGVFKISGKHRRSSSSQISRRQEKGNWKSSAMSVRYLQILSHEDPSAIWYNNGKFGQEKPPLYSDSFQFVDESRGWLIW